MLPRANQEDWEVITEQEEFLLESAPNFIVDDYDSDPECHQVRLNLNEFE